MRSVHTSTRIDVAIVVVVIAGKVSRAANEVGNALDAGIDAEEGIGRRAEGGGGKESRAGSVRGRGGEETQMFCFFGSRFFLARIECKQRIISQYTLANLYTSYALKQRVTAEIEISRLQPEKSTSNRTSAPASFANSMCLTTSSFVTVGRAPWTARMKSV